MNEIQRKIEAEKRQKEEAERLLRESKERLRDLEKELSLDKEANDTVKTQIVSELLEIATTDRLHQAKPVVQRLLQRIDGGIVSSEKIDPWQAVKAEAEVKDGVSFPALWNIQTAELYRGQVNILGAYSGVGKSWFALNIAYNCALNEQKDFLFFSHEMTQGQLWLRLLSIYAYQKQGVDSHKCTLGYMRKAVSENEQWAREAIAELQRYITVIDSGGWTAPQIFSYVQEHIATVNRQPDCICIDYLQIIPPHKEGDRRNQIIAIMENLTQDIKQHESALLLLVQATRDSERTGESNATVFQESAAIEQNAALAMHLTREKNKETKEPEPYLWLNIVKNRFNRTGKTRLLFRPEAGYIEKQA
jgi:replicative DNA helicase